ncbi:MAG: Na/Pi cotransporter family protein [Roseburia sp.]|nr:Na/Pi cotransporter family protein [Roseburia sp.]
MALKVVLSVLSLIAGLGVLMIGMKMLSDGLERSAGKGMRKLFGKISNNRFAGVGVGAITTILVNSSAATTVMVIGFVNAGLMTLFQATSIIMGANIGTTLTGVIIALSGFDFGGYMAILAFIGVAMTMFSKNDTVRKLGSAISGLGLMFVGLSFMSSALKGSDTLTQGLQTVFTKVDFPLLLIFIGIVFTALFQSSTAMTALVVTMAAPTYINGAVGAPIIPMQSALFIILGTNIGTCVTAILAAFGASTNAKRTAVIHLLFNAIGTIIFTVFIWVFKDGVVWLFGKMSSSAQMQVALFHVIFNLLTTLMLLPFIKQLTRFASFVVREKRGGEDEAPHMYYIDERFLQTPPIAVAQVKREVDHMGEMAKANLRRAMTAVLTQDLSEHEKVERDEQRINFINKGVSKYLIKLSSRSLTRSDEKFVGSLHHVVNDIERIADHADDFMGYAREMKENDCSFTQGAIDELEDMYDKVMAMFDEALFIFENNAVGKLNGFSAREEEVDMTKRLLGYNHIRRLNAGGCTVESGTYFYAITNALERIADHLTNIAFSIKSPSGSQREAMDKIAEEQKRRTRERKHNGNSLQMRHGGDAEAKQPELDPTEKDTDAEMAAQAQTEGDTTNDIRSGLRQ